MATPHPGTYDPRVLLNAQPVIVTVIDPERYRVEFQNDTGIAKLGDIAGQLCHEKITSSVSPCAFCKMPETVRTGHTTESEVPLPNDQYLLVQWSKAVTSEGQSHIIETITDISRLKRLETAARQYEKMESISRLSGSLAHNFNNLLMVILGYAHQAMRGLEPDHPKGRPLQEIVHAAERAATIGRTLLRISGREQIRPIVVDLNSWLTESQPKLRQTIPANVQLTLAIHPAPQLVSVDRLQMEQILLTLVTNAVEAMPEGGRLTIGTDFRVVDAALGERRQLTPGPYTTMTVSDSGCGMDAEAQRHIFEPGVTGKGLSTHSGLGLTSAAAAVQQYGGCIEVASQPGRGAVFTTYLPVHVPLTGAGTEEVERKPATPIRILLVEDEAGVRRMMGEILRAHGFIVHEAQDGAHALEVVRSHQDPIDLVVTDILMPCITGPQLIEHLQAVNPKIKAVFISGFSGDMLEDHHRARPFLQKPFAPATLVQIIHDAVVAA